MIHLITGGSGSGKSSYTEQQVMRAGRTSNIYIATMLPYGDEGRQRVARHKELRKEKPFLTIECYYDLEHLSLPADGASNRAILLECMSNLVANELFEMQGAREDTVQAVERGVKRLASQASELFLVTNEIFSDGILYDDETKHYLEYLGRVNRILASMADRVTEVVYGIPLQVK